MRLSAFRPALTDGLVLSAEKHKSPLLKYRRVGFSGQLVVALSVSLLAPRGVSINISIVASSIYKSRIFLVYVGALNKVTLID
jgi:hypothetical protein